MSALLPRFPWCPVDAWEPVTAPLSNGSDNRSPQRLAAVIEQFEIEKNPRFLPHDGDSFCATLVWDVTRALGCEVPHWWKGRELNANALELWWPAAGKVHGWREVLVQEAVKVAQLGLPTVVWRKGITVMVTGPDGVVSPKLQHGHMAMVRPALATDVGVQIAQAGTTCFSHGPLEHGFGRGPVRFFNHV